MQRASAKLLASMVATLRRANRGRAFATWRLEVARAAARGARRLRSCLLAWQARAALSAARAA